MLKSLFGMLAGSLLLLSCARTRIGTDTTMQGGPNASYFCGSELGLSWKVVEKIGVSSNYKMLPPKAYNSYTVANAALFFERAKAGVQEVLIPLPAGCIPFKVSPSGTMSSDLQKKYPKLVSLKGSNGAGDDLRLDWDGSTFSGQVLTSAGGKTYLITHYPGTATDSYMVYDKADSQDPKQPFETAPQAIPPANTPQRMAPPQADR